MTDTAHPTPPPKIAIGRADAPASAHRPDEVHFDRIFGMVNTVSNRTGSVADEGIRRVNTLVSNFVEPAARPEQRFATAAEMRAAPNDPAVSDEDGRDEAAFLGFFAKLAESDEPHPAPSSTPLVEEIAGKDWLEISHPPTASRSRTDRGQDPMGLPPDTVSSNRRRALIVSIGDRLALAVVVAALAAGSIWLWLSDPVQEEKSPVPYALKQDSHPAVPMAIDPAISKASFPQVAEMIPIQYPANPSVPEASSAASPVFVEQPVPAQTTEGSVEPEPLPESEDSSAPPAPTEVAVPEAELEPAAGTASVPPPASPKSIAKPQDRSMAGQAAPNPAPGQADPGQRGKSSARSQNSARQAGRVQSRPRSHTVKNAGSPFKFRWRGVVRNPWEPPARTGFNQK